MKNIIEIEKLTFRYGKETPEILKELSLYVDSGSIVAISGISGSGKSTLGACIAGVIPKYIKGDMKGKITLRDKVGIVFQNPDTQIFLPTVEDEIAFGPENLCLSREEIDKRITELLELMGMTNFRFSNPSTLSGGEKQLVVFSAVLSLEPGILICDEVLSSLDEISKDRVLGIMVKLKEIGKTIILIEHNIDSLKIVDVHFQMIDGKLIRKVVAM